MQALTKFDVLTLPIKRPMATAMFFAALMMLGSIALSKMPVALFPILEGDVLRVQFSRQGAESSFLEREILVPLESRVKSLPDIVETNGFIEGSSGNLQIEFEPDTDIRVREYELRRVASQLAREQPKGTTNIFVSSSGQSGFATIVMQIAVYGNVGDPDVLYDLAVEKIAPRFAAVNGVSRANVFGGGDKQVTVVVDPTKTAMYGASTGQVIQALSRSVGEQRFVGKLEEGTGRTDLMVDGRVSDLTTLQNARVLEATNLTVGHVSETDYGFSKSRSLFRVNGSTAVGISIYQEQSANLINVGRLVRDRLDVVQEEIGSMGINLVVLNDAAEIVEDQVGRLIRLGLIGFVLALVVLFIFLRQWRAVLVVGIAVPTSIVLALSSIYLLGFGVNLVTLFGLAVSVGLLVDNSVVVYEAILRSLERGVDPTEATRSGLRRTVRAILAASITTSIVFFPVMFVDVGSTFFQQFIIVAAAGLLLPLAASLVVAVGLVPLLAHRLAAPAAIRRVERQRAIRIQRADLVTPDRLRILLSGWSQSSLRQPPIWITGTVFAVIATLMFAVPQVTSARANETNQIADSVELIVRFGRDVGNLDAMELAVSKLETSLLEVDGVEKVVSQIEQDRGEVQVFFVDEDVRPPDLTVGKIRGYAKHVSDAMDDVEILRPGEEQFDKRRRGDSRGRSGRMGFGSSPSTVTISGPASTKLQNLGSDIVEQLKNVHYVSNAWLAVRPPIPEVVVTPRRLMFESLGLYPGSILPILRLAGMEGYRVPGDFTLSTGREVPIYVERPDARSQELSLEEVRDMRVPIGNNRSATVRDLASTRIERPRSVIVHKNGRREMRVIYRLTSDVPNSGPNREGIEEQIQDIIRQVPRPAGYTLETPEPNENVSIAGKLLLPILCFLLLVLMITFESITLPFLVLLALPLTAFGALWALVFTGRWLEPGVLVGIAALCGVSINPAILLVDRMQRRTLDAGWSAGAAAYAAVKERTRPILLTTATTISALIPLSITTGRENEIWPGFAVTMIGGLITSALLTLLVIPVGYILLKKIDGLFGRVGPWLVILWMTIEVSIMAPLIMNDVLESMWWIVITSILIGAGLLALLVLLFRKRELPEPHAEDGPPPIEVTSLRKIYGLSGPIRTALNIQREFAQKVIAAGGTVFSTTDTFERLAVFAIVSIGMTTAALLVDSVFWPLVFLMLSAAFVIAFFNELSRYRGYVDESGSVVSGMFGTAFAYGLPWIALCGYAYLVGVAPLIAEYQTDSNFFFAIVGGVLLAVGQIFRRSALKQSRGAIGSQASGFLRYPRTLLRRVARKIGGLTLPPEEVHALSSLNFKADRGMIGILGPNGAGKTTLLRQLAGILEPTGGVVKVGGVPLKFIRNQLARWVGYLPQDAGLPSGQSAREYLQYYAALYELEPGIRAERVEGLLNEVGLAEKADDKIGSLSGGMRQRVAVARTLLRLPPIIIVDEPTVGLDPRERIRFRNLLGRLAEDRIVLFSTHVVDDVSVACDRVLVLAESRKKFDGSPSDLAQFASGRVWEVTMDADLPFELSDDAILAEETPTIYGQTRRRIIADGQPHPTAVALNATLEDGYLWLIGPATT